MNDLYPLLDSSDKIALCRDVLRTLNNFSHKHQEQILLCLNLRGEDAVNFFSEMCNMKHDNISDESIKYVAGYLGEYYSVAMIGSLLAGDVGLARNIGEVNDFQEVEQINYKELHDNGFIKSDVKRLESTSEAKEFLDIIRKVSGEHLFNLTTLNNHGLTYINHDSTGYGGELPVLSGGTIFHPELLVAFNDRLSNNSYYKRMPIWIEKKDKELFNSSIVYELKDQWILNKNKSIHRPNFDGHCFDSQEDLLSNMGSSTDNTIIHFRHWVSGISAASDDILIDTILNERDKIGFGRNPKHYYLAVVDINELGLFSIGDIDDGDLIKAKEYADSFVSLRYVDKTFGVNKLYSHDINEIRGKDVLEAAHNNSSLIGDILDTYNDHRLLINRHTLYRHNRPNLITKISEKYPEICLGKYIFYRFKDRDFSALYDLGYKFNEQVLLDTKTLKKDTKVKIAKMGAWPFSGGRKPKLDDVIKGIARKVPDDEVSVLIGVSDPREVLALCKTEKQLEVALNHISGNKEDYMDLLPKKLKSKTLSRDLGL